MRRTTQTNAALDLRDEEYERALTLKSQLAFSPVRIVRTLESDQDAHFRGCESSPHGVALRVSDQPASNDNVQAADMDSAEVVAPNRSNRLRGPARRHAEHLELDLDERKQRVARLLADGLHRMMKSGGK